MIDIMAPRRVVRKFLKFHPDWKGASSGAKSIFQMYMVLFLPKQTQMIENRVF